ncbi:hypothetical protein KI655_18655 [Vibrio sp. D404a]|uniref:hypothetical protein n=1 Tax=unclassified Vibrio TaxID=2614977 RepID=UPI0025555D4A|nr:MULTISPECIES: hypothetical protein [unclassified Vibrio]MDK9739320.1 hypothetical protein [Vibrio sp. D404a]MDK9797645.1 hypothetical protein [Vibrio sp. D449a]
MNKTILVPILILLSGSFIAYQKFTDVLEEEELNSDMALSYLSDREGWLSQFEQLAAGSTNLLHLKSTVKLQVGELYISDGVVMNKKTGYCMEARYQWDEETRKQPTLLYAKECSVFATP